MKTNIVRKQKFWVIKSRSGKYLSSSSATSTAKWTDNPRISDEAYQLIKGSKSPETAVLEVLITEKFEKLFIRATDLLDFYQNGWHSRIAKHWILIALGLCSIFTLIVLCAKFEVLR